MSEVTSPQPGPRWPLRGLFRNPVTMKELRSRMRGRRAFVILTIYLALMSGLITLVYLGFAAASSSAFGPSSRQAGKAVFASVVAVQMFLVIFIGPAFTSAAISGEKERQTYDLLRTTLLSARALVTGKLLSALSYVFLLILAAIPLQSIAFLLGGVAPLELILSQLLIAVSAVTFALVGLFFSTVMRSTLAATVTTYAVSLILIFGAPVAAALFVSLLGPVLFGPTPNWLIQVVLIYAGLFLAATNLPATLIVSDVFLTEEGTLFFFTQLIDGRTVYILSPWSGYLILYTLLALLLYWVCIRRVRRVANK